MINWLILLLFFFKFPVRRVFSDYLNYVFNTEFFNTRMTSSNGNISALLVLYAGIHWSPVNSPHKGRWRGTLMISLICAWINRWVNNREAGDLRRHHANYDVTVMTDMDYINTQISLHAVLIQQHRIIDEYGEASTLNTLKLRAFMDIFSVVVPQEMFVQIFLHQLVCKMQNIRLQNSASRLRVRKSIKSSFVNKLHIFQFMGKIFCVEFQRVSVEART